MLEFFRNVAQTIPTGSEATSTPHSSNETPIPGSARDMLQDRAGIIVLREDLDFYAIPPRPDIEAAEMIEVKRAAGRALLKQNGIFSGLRRSEETGSTEQHLIEMLTAGYVLDSPLINHANHVKLGDSIMKTRGDIVLANQRKLLFAVLHWLVFVLKFVVRMMLPILTLLEWLKNCYYSGENQPEDVGGKVLNWTM